MTQIRFETGTLRDGSRTLTRAAEDLEAHLQNLVGDEPAWGSDDVSALCQMVYQAVVEVVRESVAGATETWAGHGSRLEIAATLYDSVEESNTAAADAITSELSTGV